MTTIAKGTIALNDKTQNHVDTLSRLGYNASADGKTINAECKGFHTDEVDFTGIDQAKTSCAQLITDSKLWTMSTKFRLPGREKPLYGFPLLRILSNSEALRNALGFDPSALIVKAPRKPKTPKVSYPEDVSSRKDKRSWLAGQLGLKKDGLSLKVLREKYLNRTPVSTDATLKENVDSLDAAIQVLRSSVEQPLQTV